MVLWFFWGCGWFWLFLRLEGWDCVGLGGVDVFVLGVGLIGM